MSNVKEIDSKESSIVEGLLNESALKHLFESLCFTDIENIRMIEVYSCNSEHTGLIVEARNKNTNDKETIIIDVVAGYPMTEQIYEAVYKKGSNCNRRIIAYTKGFADLDEYGGGDDDAIKNLVENLNGYGTNISLVKMKYDPDEGGFKYSLTEEPSGNLDYDPSDLPSEAKLKEEEFWEIYYWQQFEDAYYPLEAFTGVLHDPREYAYGWGPDGGAEFYLKWTDQGLFFEVIGGNYEIENLESVWNSRKHELQMSFPDEEMTFILKNGKLQVKVWSTPVQSLVNTTISEKKRMAGEILEKFNEFQNDIIFPTTHLKNENIEEAKEAEQLA